MSALGLVVVAVVVVVVAGVVDVVLVVMAAILVVVLVVVVGAMVVVVVVLVVDAIADSTHFVPTHHFEPCRCNRWLCPPWHFQRPQPLLAK
jgi:hypothetical protein